MSFAAIDGSKSPAKMEAIIKKICGKPISPLTEKSYKTSQLFKDHYKEFEEEMEERRKQQALAEESEKKARKREPGDVSGNYIQKRPDVPERKMQLRKPEERITRFKMPDESSD